MIIQQQWLSRYVMVFSLWFIVASLAGCDSNTLHGQFDAYENRLLKLLEERGQSLSVDVSYPEPSHLPEHSPLKLKKVALPDAKTISLIEFARLDFCGIAKLVAEHNTQLGKLATPSQRFVYELKLLEKITDCDRDVLTKEQASWLNQLADYKTSQLNQHWQYFLTHSSELTQIFQAGSSNINFPVERLQSHFFALSALDNLHKNYRLSSSIVEAKTDFQHVETPKKYQQNLEISLETLSNPLIGESFRALQYAAKRLDRINWILANNTSLVHCEAKRSHKYQEILQNVFQHFYVKKIQPNLSTLSQDIQSIQPLLDKLYGFQPDNFRHYFFNTEINDELSETIIGHLNQSFREHAHWWVAMRKQCESVKTKNAP